MLEKFREGAQGPAAKIILGVVILSFALAGIGSYLGRPTDTDAAIVNGDKISRQTFEQGYQNERARLENQLGDAFAMMADNPAAMAQFRKDVLERMVNELLLDQQAKALGLRISDAQIKAAIRQMPEFQADGKFSNERYLALLRQAGYAPEQFGQLLRRDMMRQQLVSGLQGSEFTLAGERQVVAGLLQQQRDIRYAVLPVDAFVDQADVSDDELKAYYEQYPEQFRSEEQVKVSYVQLDADRLAESIKVDEQQIEQYYQEHQDSYTQPERRRASHILIAFGDDKAAARARAEALQAQLQAGADFAELAKKASDDAFSGQNGGDLDWMEQGVMDPAFDEAVFALPKPGALSAVVESPFGFHIIKLTDLQPASVMPLEQVHEDIAASIRHNEAMDQFYGLQQTLAEVSFEIPDTLDDAAEAVGAIVQHADWFSRSDAPDALADPKVLQVAFGDQAIDDRLNSELITLEQNRVMVLRVTDHRQPSTQPFEQVEDKIRQRLVQQKAAAKAFELQQQIVKSVRAGESVDALLADVGSEFTQVEKLTRENREVNASIVKQAFAMAKPDGDTPVVAALSLDNGDKVVVQLSAVHAAPAPALPDNYTAQLNNIRVQAQLKAVIQELKADADIRYPYDVTNP